MIYFLAFSLNTSIAQNEKIQFDTDSQMNISFEETISLENSSSISMQTSVEDSSNLLKSNENILPDNLSSIELPSIDNNREHTMSDTSSDTVDYDFDTETCATLTFESQQTSIPLSDCHDSNC
jgi:hypothetical protein